MERISTHQFMMVTAGVILGFTFIPVAQMAVMEGTGRDGWLAVLPGFAAAIPLGLMVIHLWERFPGRNMVQISEVLLGKWVAKVIGLVYVGVCGYFGGLLLAENRDVFQRAVMPEAPNLVFGLGTGLLVIMLAWLGIEVLARFAEVVLPVVVISLSLVLIISIPRFEWEEFFPLPMLENGPLPALQGAWRLSGFAGEYILFLCAVLPFLPAGQGGRLRTGIWRGVLLAGVLDTLVTLAEIIIFGPVETGRLNAGMMSLGKMIEISKTVSGVESIFMIVLMGANILKVTAMYLGVLWGLQAVFGFQDQMWLYLAVGVILMGIAWAVPGGTWLAVEIAKSDIYLVRSLSLVWVPVVWGGAQWRGRRQQG